MSLRRALAIALVALAGDGASGAIPQQRLEALRYAVLVEGEEGDGIRALERVLRDSYSFQVLVVARDAARRAAIVEAMAGVSRLVRPYDEVFVLIGLPVLHDAFSAKVAGGLGLSYQPLEGRRDEPWTLLPFHEVADWLAELPTSASLLVQPGCGGPLRAAEEEALARFNRGKRPGPLNVVEVCDESGGAPTVIAGSARSWRAEALAAATARILSAASAPESGGLGSAELAHRLAAELESIRLTVRTFPDGAGEVRLQSTGTVDGYRNRYEQATSYDDARRALVDFAAAAGESEMLRTGLVALLGEIAVDPRAGVAAASVDERAALELRRAAIDLLQRDGGSAARALLAALIPRAVDSSAIRAYAVGALSRSPDIGGRERAALRAALDDADAAVREAAVLGLSVAGDEETAARFRRLVRTDPVLGVRLAALQALAALQRAADRDLFVQLLDHEAPELRREAAVALGRLGPSAAASAALLARLADDADETVRQRAAHALGSTVEASVRSRVVGGLVAALSTGSEAVARAAASSLGRSGGAEAERALVAALTGRTPEGVRVEAAAALGKLGGDAAVVVLERIADVECTGAAERSVAQRRLERGVARACVEPAAVRRAAVSALAAIGGERVAPTLFAKLEDPDPFVRREAMRALSTEEAKSARYHPTDLAQQSAPTRAFAYEHLVDPSDAQGFEILVAGLSDQAGDAREKAIAGLSRRGDATAIARVAEVLAVGDLVGRQSAARVLGAMPGDDPALVAALAAGARDASSAVRAESLRALGRRRVAPAREPLLAGLDDAAAEVRLAAVEALAWLATEGEVRNRLQGLAKDDPAPEVRTAAITALTGFAPTAKR